MKIEICSPVWIRQAANIDTEKVQCANVGEVYEYTDIEEDSTFTWYKVSNGYLLGRDGMIEYVKKVEDSTPTTAGGDTAEVTKPEDGAGKISEEDIKAGSSFSDLAEIDFSEYRSDLGSGKDRSKHFLKNCEGIAGMPYQFMPEVDPRFRGSANGREFTENVVSRVPLLFLTPGKPIFMKGYDDKQKKDILKFASELNVVGNKIDELLDKKNGRYYSFGFNYQEYWDYVNAMCQSAAIFLGIGDKVYKDGKKLRNYKWETDSNDLLRSFISNQESIAFYIDSETQITESFSNQTSQSQLMEFTNQASNLSREIQFLLGGMSGKDFSKYVGNAESVMDDFKSFGNKYLGDGMAGSLIGSLVDTGVTTVVAGGKMIFPEIWQDSSYTRDYDVTIKLRSPDCDTFSLFLNLFVPMFKIVALTAPQSLGANGYKSPFLVRGFYKGMWNCDMGMITSLSIARGDKCNWTRRGIPTQIDINFTIKDLYTFVTLTSSKNPIKFCHNTCLLNWISNQCAININKPDIIRKIELYYTMISNNAKDILTLDSFSGVKQAMTNLLNYYIN